MEDKLITIGRFATPDAAEIARLALGEAGIASRLGGAATATWLWHYGTALGGVQLLVRSQDVQQAESVLQESLGHEEDLADLFESEPEACDDLETDAVSESVDALASRAWKAAVLGLLFCPPALTFYSIWLLLDERLWKSNEDRPRDWRLKAAAIVNAGTLSWILFLAWIFAPAYNPSYYPPPPPMHRQEHLPGQPPQEEDPRPITIEKEIVIPLIPG